MHRILSGLLALSCSFCFSVSKDAAEFQQSTSIVDSMLQEQTEFVQIPTEDTYLTLNETITNSLEEKNVQLKSAENFLEEHKASQSDYISTENEVSEVSEVSEKSDKIDEKNQAETKERKAEKTDDNIDVSQYGEPDLVLDAKLTAYCSCHKCCGKYAENRPKDENGKEIVLTASGAVAEQGKTVGVDPSVIPLGSIIVVDGHQYVAQDTGNSKVVKSNVIDVYFENHQEALNFGVHRAKALIFFPKNK